MELQIFIISFLIRHSFRDCLLLDDVSSHQKKSSLIPFRKDDENGEIDTVCLEKIFSSLIFLDEFLC